MTRLVLMGLLLTHVSARLANAEVPAVTNMFPMGAQRGTKGDIAAEGKLPAGTQVASTEGITFKMPEKGNTIQVEISDLVQPGLHWLRFHNADGSGEPVPFVVGQLSEVTETEPNDSLAKGNKVSATCVINGKLGQGGDVDVFSFPLTKGQTVVASVEANWNLGSPVDMVMQLVNPRRAVLEQNDDDHGNDPLLYATAPSDGEFHVRVFGFPTQPNSTIAFAGGSTFRYRLTVSVNSFANHAIPSVVSAEGKTQVRLTGWNLSEPLQKPFELTGTAQQFVHAELGNVVPLSVFNGSVFSANEPCDKSKPIEVTLPCAISGVVDEPGDEDVFRFTAKKNEKLVFRVESRSLGMPLDPTVTLYDSSGVKIAENDDSTRNEFDATLAATMRADGDYLVGVRDLYDDGGWRFHYRLFIEQPLPSVSMSSAAHSFVLALDKPLEIPVTIGRANGFAEELEVSIEGLPEGVSCESVKSEAKGDSSKAVKLIVKNADAATAAAFSGAIRIVGKFGDGRRVEAQATLATYDNFKLSDLWLTRKAAPVAKTEATPEAKPESKSP